MGQGQEQGFVSFENSFSMMHRGNSGKRARRSEKKERIRRGDGCGQIQGERQQQQMQSQTFDSVVLLPPINSKRARSRAKAKALTAARTKARARARARARASARAKWEDRVGILRGEWKAFYILG